MKNLLGLTFSSLFLIGSANVWGQLTQAKLPPPSPYAITAQDANSRVWQRRDYTMSPAGGVITNTHSYTELCSGLNHFANGKFVESNDRIDILPNGTAVATNGQHSAFFPGNLYSGQIELVTPDGQHLKSRPLILAYFDGTNTVVIAELTNSIGVVVGNNQVIYPNSFRGLKADLQYYYTKSGFEQNIVIKEQPPTPESMGLNSDTARLQIFTEFFSPPQPTLQSTVLPAQAGLSLTDQSLNFGAMQMIQGRAFLLGPSAQSSGALVSKHWVQVNGRQFLVEEVPVDAILEGLAALPFSAMNSSSNKNAHTASRRLVLPPQRLVKNNTSKTMLLAMAELPMQGFVLDYQTLNSSPTNFNFKGDTTYYISGSLTLLGTNTFEGSAVLKYANGASLNFVSIGTGAVKMLSTAYRPVIFTARDDNSVGETISGSTGTPTNYYANPALSFSYSPGQTLSNFRIACAYQAISTVYVPLTVFNAQIINCQSAVGLNDASLYFRNVLFANVITNFNDAMYGAIDVQNGTFNNIKYLIAQPFNNGVTLNLTNSVFANVTNLSAGSFTFTTNASYNGFYNSPSFGTTTYGSSTYPFQSIGAGNYYLTNGCLFFNQGTTNIDQVLLAGLKQRTTYPPFLYSNITVSINTTLSPQAQRDTDSIDLGYHYDPIDYLVDTFAITNATLTVTNGTAIASYNEPGVQLRDGSSIHSYGSPLYPNWFVRYTSVQEQCVLLGGTNPASGLTVSASHYSSVGPTGQFLFSQFACPAGGGYLFYDVGTNAYNSLLVQNCELWGGPVDFSGYSNTVTTLKNNLFVRTSFSASTTANTILSVSNNLFYGMAVFFYNQATPNTWQAFNNAYDSCGIYYNPYVPIGQLTNGYNAYLNCSGFNGYLGQLWPTNVFDLVTNATLAYQTGPLGTFYQPSNSPLINMGSTNSDLLGLYHYTVLTNLVNGLEIKETNSTVDIGYHYVATDANGIPIDTDADGVPDYLGDANGNGSIDPGETPWYSPPVILVQPHDQTVKVGDTATFQVQVSSAMPVTYQWRKDGITIAGATGDTLTIPNAQDAQAGSYSVLVSNGGGQTTSLDSQLVTLTLYPGSPLYTITATGVAANMALDIYGTPALGLTHGYRVCVFGSPGQSVFKFPPPSWPKGFFSADTTDDLDNDGLTFGYEHYVSGSNPATPITTSGVIPDGWKAEWGLDPTSFAVNDSSAGDPDVDGISNLNEYNAGVNSTDPFKINSSPRPVVTIASSSTSATLGGADATFVVTRTGSFSTDVTVNYTVGGSAVYNTDYQILPNPGTYYPFSIHIPIGSATAIIAVHALSTQHSVQTIIVGLVPISIADSPSPATWPYVVDPRNDRFSGTVSSVATPTFSPNGGTFAILQNVTVNCATAGAIIHYTLNGNVPTTSDPIVTGGNTVAVPYALTLEAKAFMSNPLVSSAVQSASFVITYGDTDGDGLADAMEAVFGGKPFTLDPGWKWDTDNDGLPDTYETMIGLSKTTAEPAPGLPVNYNKCPL